MPDKTSTDTRPDQRGPAMTDDEITAWVDSLEERCDRLEAKLVQILRHQEATPAARS